MVKGGRIWEFYPISVDFTSIVVINIYRQKERFRSSLIWDSSSTDKKRILGGSKAPSKRP
jgi:hypothetical protein